MTKPRDANDVYREEGPEGVRALNDQAKPFEAKANGSGRTGRPAILSKADFLKDFVPPDFLVEGILQRRFIYALTGQTGGGKTALALLVSQLVGSVAPDAMLANHEVEQGQVVYFAGENPDDIRMRLIGADARRSDDPSKDRITFIPGVFDIGGMFAALETELGKRGELALVIVDTSAAYFLGNEELSNTQMGAHARMLRKLTTLPGGPCALVLCHPIKHVEHPWQLVPRGGGAFLNEMDGNLTAWKHDDVLVDLHHTKIRGPGFESMSFRLDKFTTPKLTDSKGRLIMTVRALPISESEEQSQSETIRADEDTLLAAMLFNTNCSMADFARALGWFQSNGEPAKSRVQRALERLEKTKPKLVRRNRGKWLLTDEGEKAATLVAKRDGGDDREAEAAEGRTDRFRSVGKAPPGTLCIYCQKSTADVLKIRDAGEVGSKPETLHRACAEAWFSGGKK